MLTEDVLLHHMKIIQEGSELALLDGAFGPHALFFLDTQDSAFLPLSLLPTPLWNKALLAGAKQFNPLGIILVYTSYCIKETAKWMENITHEKAAAAVAKLADQSKHNTLITYGKTPMLTRSIVREYKVKNGKAKLGVVHDDAEAKLVTAFFDGIFDNPENLQ
jgi:hypothetical protein